MRTIHSIHWAWIILALCFFNLFVNYSVRLGYGVILPEMIRDLTFSRTAGGSIYNSYLFVYLVLSPFTEFLTDRFGARRVIATCSLILGTGVILIGTVQGLVSACLFYAVVGLGATGMIRDTTGSYHFAFGISAVMSALGFFLFLMLKKVAQPSCMKDITQDKVNKIIFRRNHVL